MDDFTPLNLFGNDDADNATEAKEETPSAEVEPKETTVIETVEEQVESEADSIKKYASNLGNLGDHGLPVKLFLGLVNILAMVAVVVCGSAITAVITFINIVILLVFMAIVYIGFTIIWIVDRLYLVRKKIFTACHECKEKSLIPT